MRAEDIEFPEGVSPDAATFVTAAAIFVIAPIFAAAAATSWLGTPPRRITTQTVPIALGNSPSASPHGIRSKRREIRSDRREIRMGDPSELPRICRVRGFATPHAVRGPRLSPASVPEVAAARGARRPDWLSVNHITPQNQELHGVHRRALHD